MPQSLRALVSVSDKTNLEWICKTLAELGYQLVSTGGTFQTLARAGLPVIELSSYTGFPEILDGRVKTLHPRVHGGLLGRPNLPEHRKALEEHGILPFQIVICNLYPFAKTISKPGFTHEEAVENIDIGGPSMIRSAAKNHEHVAVVTSPDQYEEVAKALREGKLDLAFREKLAASAFAHTAAYDQKIAEYFSGYCGKQLATGTEPASLPRKLNLSFELREELRYGENSHQRGAFYVEEARPGSLAAAEKFHGKELSYNNLLDLDAALQIVQEFRQPACSVIKHNNPCGGAVAETLAEALQKALDGDPVSAFGSIVGFNQVVDSATAEILCGPDRFVEAIIAPDFDPHARELLTTKPKWRANVRLLRLPTLNSPSREGFEFRTVTGGILVQDRDCKPDPESEWKVVTQKTPSESELKELRFAWTMAKYVKSNSIVLVKDQSLIGVGAGQMSRLDSVRISAEKAGPRGRGAVLGSDAFFPFRDGIDQAAAAGVVAIIQPGGSKKDDEVIAACNEHGIAMLFTGRRHFRH